jgi:outer membrane protein TolC
MKQGLSMIIGLALVLGSGNIVFASANISGDTVNSQGITTSASTTLSLDDVLGNIEKNSVQIQTLDQKILLYQRQYDRDIKNRDSINAEGKPESTYPNGQYAEIKIQTDILPMTDEQNINDAKYNRSDSLENLKLTTESQYFAALSAKDQINTIQAQIKNVDEQIKQTEVKIQQGQLTNEALETLKVQKSQLQASLNSPQASLQENLLSIKQALNMDLDAELNLVYTEKTPVKFDDSSIQDEIDKASENNYNVSKIKNNISILQNQEEIYKKYSYNDSSGEITSALSIQDLQNSLNETISQNKIALWNSYYAMKNTEDQVAVENSKVESAQSEYNSIAAKVKQGVALQIEADSAQLALESEKINLKNAQNNYAIAVEKFEYDLSK